MLCTTIKEVLEHLQKEIHETAKSKGWWDNSDKNFGELIALMHSELSEALEGEREGNPASDHIPDFTFVEEELADCVIRIFDTADGLKLDVIGAIIAKHQYNKTREYKHGGKKF